VINAMHYNAELSTIFTACHSEAEQHQLTMAIFEEV
jgi:hypothetical protein